MRPVIGAAVVATVLASAEMAQETASETEAERQLQESIRELERRRDAVDTGALREAIEDLMGRHGEAYPRGPEFLARLDKVEEVLAVGNGLANLAAVEEMTLTVAVEGLERLQHEALVDNPLVGGQPVLFVTRKQYKPDHHNTATLFQTGEVNTFKFDGGSTLEIVDLRTGEAKTLLATDSGVIRDPELHFDARRIVFSMRRDIADDYHIWEIDVDGNGLRQITSTPGVSDVDPMWLPDDSIVFSSTREPKFCMCNQHIMANLFRMDSDGANAHQIGKSTLFEGHGALLPDGRILYDRWEYIDRNFGDAQGLWTVNPDGTNPCVYWGNNTNSPGGVIDARPIPGTQRTLCIFGSCHDRPWGAIAILDRRLGLDGRDAVVRTWPADAIERVGHGNWDAFLSVTPKYEDPWPLDENTFLASRTTGNGEEMALYLLDTFGNELLLHSETPGCYDPIPVKPRRRPGTMAERRDLALDEGAFFVADVYQGTHMQGVERGSVKWLRVIESPEKRFFTDASWGGQGVEKPAMNWHDFNNKRILGTVPVHEDGSAHFTAPADTYLYFQLLDSRGMMVQSMRSGTMVQAGETTGCIGCHEDRRGAPPTSLSTTPLAVRRAADPLDGWRGPPRLFNFMADVQPVFDAKCTSCHDYGQEAAETLNLAADRTTTFNTSYNELWRKGYLAAIGAGPSETQAPRTWGSHASKLISTLRDGHPDHEDIALTGEEFDRLATWVDLNAPFYPRYDCAYPDHLAGRSPLTNEQTQRLAELTGVPFMSLASHNNNRGPQVSFDRPELSPCLATLRDGNEEAYAEALAILRAGGAMLEARPRADMPGFVPCAEDQRRARIYAERERIEQRNRTAVLEGKKAYDGTEEPDEEE